MNVIQICYDLKNASEESYQKLFNKIRSLGNAEHVQLSVWLLSTHLNASQVKGILITHLKKSDSLLVTEVVATSSSNITPAAIALVKRTWSQPKLVIDPNVLPLKNMFPKQGQPFVTR